MAFRKTARTLSAEMNVANLVDVTFALLIIFMITAPLMSQGVKVDLPKTDSKNIDVRETIQITIDRKRSVFIDDTKVSLLSFEKEFRKEFPGPQTPVVINADRRVPYGFVVEIINRLQKVGVEKLSFLTEIPPRNRS